MPPQQFNIVIVAQAGRLQYEALLFAASLRHFCPDFQGTLYLAEPLPGPLWPKDPRIRSTEMRAVLEDMGGVFVPFESRHFGHSYPQGNKIECLAALPKDEPFVFFDTDTLITGDVAQVPFDFDRPSASLRREGTWPKPQIYGAGYSEVWGSLYERFGLDFESSLDPTQPDEYWRRYLYFNASFFYYRCPQTFGARFAEYAAAIRDDPGDALAAQRLDPWLDQIALPLVIHGLGGERNALAPGFLDADVSCHYRTLPLLYARESDHVVDVLETVCAPNKLKKLLKTSEAFKRLVYQGRGHKVRAMFDRDDLPRREQAIRKAIKEAGFWLR